MKKILFPIIALIGILSANAQQTGDKVSNNVARNQHINQAD